jgi:hypothetical protein
MGGEGEKGPKVTDVLRKQADSLFEDFSWPMYRFTILNLVVKSRSNLQ